MAEPTDNGFITPPLNSVPPPSNSFSFKETKTDTSQRSVCS